MGGEGRDEVQEFCVYCPKAMALIGELDGVLADRCLPVSMTRKTDADIVLPFRSRLIEPEGKKLHTRIKQWAKANSKVVADTYDHLDVFTIKNDRLAELLLPLQAVLAVDDKERLPELAKYAESLDRKDAEQNPPVSDC